MGSFRSIAVTMVTLFGLAAMTDPAAAGRCHWGSTLPESYSALKLGIYSPRSTGAPDGFYGGLEFGFSVSPRFDLGVTGDLFHRSRSAGTRAFDDFDPPYDLPVDGSVNATASSTNLGMLGLGARLRFPFDGGGPAPFVSGGLLLQILHLSSLERVEIGGGYLEERERSDTFAGVGWHAGGGVDLPLDGRIGFLAELGYVHARPTKELNEPGYVPVTLRANASGYYLRGGLRISY